MFKRKNMSPLSTQQPTDVALIVFGQQCSREQRNNKATVYWVRVKTILNSWVLFLFVAVFSWEVCLL